MAKRTRKKAAAIATKKSTVLTRKKSAKAKNAKAKNAGRKAATAKQRRKVATKVAAPKKSAPVPKTKAAPEKAASPSRKSFVEKVEGAVGAMVDIFTDAERLHRRLDPGISNEPE